MSDDYVEKLLIAKDQYEGQCSSVFISALCGTVYEHGKIAINHRGYMVRHKYFHVFDYWSEYKKTDYENELLKCDIASFCGLMISKKIIDKIGYPRKEYFIRYDDTEYSLRLCREGKIINVNSSTINHKIKVNNSKKSFDWKFYYDVRNSIDMTNNNKLYYCYIRIAIKSFITAIINGGISLWIVAMRDGLKGKLGKKELTSL